MSPAAVLLAAPDVAETNISPLPPFSSPAFFDASANDVVSFTSTAIEVTGDDTAKVTGDLTPGGVTKSVLLDTTLNQVGDRPRKQKPWFGFTATTALPSYDFDAGAFAPFVGDEVETLPSIEAGQIEV